MADKYSGSRLNEGLINKLKQKINNIEEEGKKNESAPDKSSLEKLTITKADGSSEDIYVTAKDKEAYDKINYVKEILDFGEFELSQVYDLVGGKIKSNGTSSAFRLYLPVVEAPSLVERIINSGISEVIDIEFPQEFYRLHSYFKDDEAKLPESDMEVPRPKKGDETIEEYEQFLEEEYKKHGIEKTQDAGTNWRMPYPHEKVDYKKELDLGKGGKKSKAGITKVEDQNKSGYYPVYVEEQKKVKGRHRRTGAGRHKVTGSRVSSILGTSKNFIQNLLKARVVNLGISKYFIAGAAGFGVSTLLLSGGIPAALASAAIAAGAIKAIDMIKYSQPYKKRKKPEREAEPVEGIDEPITTTDTEESDLDLAELEAIRKEIEENLVQIKKLAAAYDVKRNQLIELKKDPDANKDAIERYENDIAQIIMDLKELSSSNDEILNAYMDSVNKKGRSL